MNSETTGSGTFHVLLVEDDPADVRLTREALEECKTPYTLHVTRDGIHTATLPR